MRVQFRDVVSLLVTEFCIAPSSAQQKIRMMNRLSTGGKIKLGLAGAIAAHAAAIELFKWQRKVEPEFKLGSADELLADNLSSGDIVLFNRRFYRYHLPTALMIKAQQMLYETEFDHGGVIVMKSGVPYLLEKTPFWGVKCRPFEDRVRNSAAAHIIVIPVEKKVAITERQKKTLQAFVQREVSERPDIAYGELVGFLSCAFNFVMDKLFSSKTPTGYYCTNAELILRAWGALSYSTHADGEEDGDARAVTLKAFHDRSVGFDAGTSGGGKAKLADNDVLIRSS
jgi:hypothetical protein